MSYALRAECNMMGYMLADVSVNVPLLLAIIAVNVCTLWHLRRAGKQTVPPLERRTTPASHHTQSWELCFSQTPSDHTMTPAARKRARKQRFRDVRFFISSLVNCSTCRMFMKQSSCYSRVHSHWCGRLPDHTFNHGPRGHLRRLADATREQRVRDRFMICGTGKKHGR